MKAKGQTTQIIHLDRLGSIEHGSLHMPIHTSVAYGHKKAEDLAGVFQGTKKGYAYARQANPTVSALEAKITMLEKGVGSLCFSTGMAALGGAFLSLLNAGDHIVSSSYLFGNTNSLLNTLERIGINVSFVDATKVEEVEKAIRPKTKIVLVETIANPVTQVADLKKIGNLCADKKLIYLVDNTMTSPFLFQPVDVKATFSLNSLTKYIGGHGDALGGCITDLGNFDWTEYSNIMDIYQVKDKQKWALVQIRKKGLRDFGAALSPEDAHRLAIGCETLTLRMERSCHNASCVAELLEQHPAVSQVNYPGLKSHPQYALSQELFKYSGSLLSFVVGDNQNCMDVLNRLELVINSSNLGDNRTLGIPVAHTIFFEMGPKRRAEMGIDESLIRLSVGIEDTEDLLEDFKQALG